MFSAAQLQALDADLLRSNVKTREQSGRKLSFIEGWHAIAEANRIFGFDGWSSETIEVKCVSEKPREIGAAKAPGFGVTYIAKVRITAGGIVREGVGTGHGIDRDLGQAHESAIKESETDARKRGLMTFGNQFGLALYDKSQENVEDDTRPTPKTSVEPITKEEIHITPRILALRDEGKQAAEGGKGVLLTWWARLPYGDQKVLEKYKNLELKPIAERADKAPAGV